MASRGRVLLLGATGLVGARVLARLLDDEGPARGVEVLAPSRRALTTQHRRLRTLVCDPATPAGRDALTAAMLADAGHAGPDAVICCLGSTLRAAGSAAAFAAIDRDLVVRLAGDARAAGAGHAIVVSSVGASASARGLYLRVKGEMEAGVAALGFARCDFLRPGLLVGERTERRPLEALAQRLLPMMDPLLLGGLRRYRTIDADRVAAAAVALLGHTEPGVHRHEHASLLRLAEAQ